MIRAAEPHRLPALEVHHQHLRSVAGTQPFRLVVICGGRVVVNWSHGISPEQRINTRSVAKSLHVSLLGCAVADGLIDSVDDRVADHYPYFLDVPEGRGPKAGRYATPADEKITFRHLAAQVSGYLKPDEMPGHQWHYQTFGMNVLAHALAFLYGHYRPELPADKQPSGVGTVIEQRIRDPIGATWRWGYSNFPNLPHGAHVGAFGNNVHIHATATDLARLGWLWLCDGDWFGETVLPRGWTQECSRPSNDLQGVAPPEEWVYGQGFWVNHDRTLWPRLPAASFAAWGRGGTNVWMAPELDLVVVTAPVPLGPQAEETAATLDTGVVADLVEAITA